MSLSRIPLILAALLLVAAADSSEEPWDIISKTTTMQRAPDGTRIISFIDDVVIKHGELTSTADRARYLEQQRRAILDGHVVMWQDSTIVRGPYTFYDRNTGIARFPYGVVIERASGTAVGDQGVWRREDNRFELRGDAAAADTTGTIDAQAMTYDMGKELFWAVGDARMVDDATGVVVEGQTLKYDRGEGTARVTGEPRTVFTDDDGFDIRVTSELMTYDPVSKFATAERNVVIRRDTMTATAGRAEFDREIDRAVLTEEPEMIDGATAIRGERIEMLSPGPGRRTVKVFGAAVVANRFMDRGGEDGDGEDGGPASPDGGDSPAAPDDGPAAPDHGPVAPDDGPVPPEEAGGLRAEQLPPMDDQARATLRQTRTRMQEHIDLVKQAAAEEDAAAEGAARPRGLPRPEEQPAQVVVHQGAHARPPRRFARSWKMRENALRARCTVDSTALTPLSASRAISGTDLPSTYLSTSTSR